MKNREKTVDNVAGNANSLAAQSDETLMTAVRGDLFF